MNRIFSRFPDETVKTASSYRGNFGRGVTEIGDTLFIDERDASQILDKTESISYSTQWIDYFRFRPETGNQKYPNNPVNPVY